MTAEMRFRAAVADILAKAPSDPEAAAQVLKIAAQCLRAGELMPPDLASFLADAFESAALKPDEHSRAKTLARDLHLIAGGNRRPKASYVKVAQTYERFLLVVNKTVARSKCAEQFEIDERTVQRYLAQYNREASKERNLLA